MQHPVEPGRNRAGLHTNPSYFNLYYSLLGFFPRGFNIGQVLTYYFFKMDLILSSLFLTLSTVITALKDNTGLQLSNVKIISDLNNNASENVFSFLHFPKSFWGKTIG